MTSLKVILPVQDDLFTKNPYDGGFQRWPDFIKAIELALLPISTQLRKVNFAEDYVFNSTFVISTDGNSMVIPDDSIYHFEEINPAYQGIATKWRINPPPTDDDDQDRTAPTIIPAISTRRSSYASVPPRAPSYVLELMVVQLSILSSYVMKNYLRSSTFQSICAYLSSLGKCPSTWIVLALNFLQISKPFNELRYLILELKRICWLMPCRLRAFPSQQSTLSLLTHLCVPT